MLPPPHTQHHTCLAVAGVTCEATIERGHVMQALPTRGAFMESMASQEDGFLASLCTGYPQILTHVEKTLSLSNWQPHSITYGMAYNLPGEL